MFSLTAAQGVTKRAGRRKEEDNWSTAAVKGKNDNPRPKKATYEIKKKEVGLTDLTLISKITNEAINDNLKLRFDNAQIYVGACPILGFGSGEETD